MLVHSLVHRTELNLARFEGEVFDRGEYTVVRTPSHADYYWGNYILFSAAPRQGDCARWTALYRDEFPYYDRITHMAFAWDLALQEQGETHEFVNAGFSVDKDLSLYASKVNAPPRPNDKVLIRPIAGEVDQAVELMQLTCGGGFDPASYREFSRRRMATYQAMANAGMGNWFGAFLGDRLAGQLGLFHDGKTGLILDVATNPEFARQGICGTLVHAASSLALREYGISTLALGADPGYHAARIYESVGFIPGETTYSLEWSGK
ncbi:MAG: GNAT family N-acetyltransferase [Candidatus Coatesbacteria bacterium]